MTKQSQVVVSAGKEINEGLRSRITRGDGVTREKPYGLNIKLKPKNLKELALPNWKDCSMHKGPEVKRTRNSHKTKGTGGWKGRGNGKQGEVGKMGKKQMGQGK